MLSTIVKKFIAPFMLVTVTLIMLVSVCFNMSSHITMHIPASAAVTIFTSNHQPECCGAGIAGNTVRAGDIFLSLPPTVRDGLFLSVLGLMAIFAFLRFVFRGAFSIRQTLSSRLYLRHNPDIPCFNHLKWLFACGILNAKIY